MSISLTCACGKKLKVKNNAVGKKVRCPVCGKSRLIEAPQNDDEPAGEDEEEEEAPRRKKSKKSSSKRKVRHAKEGWLSQPVLGMKVGMWLILVGVLGAIALAALIIVPLALPSFGADPFYTVEDPGDHLLVTLYNTAAGDFQVKVRKRAVRNDFGTLGLASGLGGFELPETRVQGKRTLNGKTVSYEIDVKKDRGVAEVIVDGKHYRFSQW